MPFKLKPLPPPHEMETRAVLKQVLNANQALHRRKDERKMIGGTV